MTPTSANVFNLYKLYKEYFGRESYYIDPEGKTKSYGEDVQVSGLEKNPRPRGTVHYSKKNIAFNKSGSYGQDIWSQNN